MSEDPSIISSEPAPAGADPVAAPAGDPATPAATPTPAGFNFWNPDGNLNEGLSEHLTDEYKGVRSFFDKYKGSENPTAEVIKGIHNMQYFNSQKGFERPGEDAPEEVMTEFNSRMKILNKTPETAEGYNFTRPADLDESIPFDDEEAKAYSEIMHKHNASPELAKDLIEMYGKGLAGVPGAVEAEEAAHRAGQIEILRNEHGPGADKVIKEAENAGQLMGWSKELISHMAMTAEGVNAMAQIKTLISGDMMPNTGSTDGVQAGGGSNYLEKAMESSKLAFEAEKRGDITAMNKHYADQANFNQMHINASR